LYDGSRCKPLTADGIDRLRHVRLWRVSSQLARVIDRAAKFVAFETNSQFVLYIITSTLRTTVAHARILSSQVIYHLFRFNFYPRAGQGGSPSSCNCNTWSRVSKSRLQQAMANDQPRSPLCSPRQHARMRPLACSICAQTGPSVVRNYGGYIWWCVLEKSAVFRKVDNDSFATCPQV
jgi:hypothetical protein